MSISLYMDENIPHVIAVGLRVRGVDVLTAQEDSRRQTDDSILLDRAGALGRVMVSFDADMLIIGARRHHENLPFPGVIFAHPTRISVGDLIQDLELIAKVGNPEDMANTILYLPV